MPPPHRRQVSFWLFDSPLHSLWTQPAPSNPAEICRSAHFRQGRAAGAVAAPPLTYVALRSPPDGRLGRRDGRYLVEHRDGGYRVTRLRRYIAKRWADAAAVPLGLTRARHRGLLHRPVPLMEKTAIETVVPHHQRTIGTGGPRRRKVQGARADRPPPVCRGAPTAG